MQSRNIFGALLTARRHVTPLSTRDLHRISLYSHCNSALQKARPSVVADGHAPFVVSYPLAELPVTASVSIKTLLDWYAQQQKDLQGIGHKLSQTFDGPTAEDLQASELSSPPTGHTRDTDLM